MEARWTFHHGTPSTIILISGVTCDFLYCSLPFYLIHRLCDSSLLVCIRACRCRGWCDIISLASKGRELHLTSTEGSNYTVREEIPPHLRKLWSYVCICAVLAKDFADATMILYLWCGGLNENSSHKLICQNTWSAISETIWEGLGDVSLGALLEGSEFPIILG